MSAYEDPHALALLLVQQYLQEQGYSTALAALERDSGIKYDDNKPRRGSELMELVYQHMERSLTDQLPGKHSSDSLDPTGSNSSSSSSRHHRQQQQAKLQEELMLRSSAADYPSFVDSTLGPLPSNLLAVLLWPRENLVVNGAADGSVTLISFEAEQQRHQHLQQQQHGEEGALGSTSGPTPAGSSSRVVWTTQLTGAGGVLTLSWHPDVQAGRHRFAASQGSPSCLLLAGCMDGSVHVLHAATGRVVASTKPHTKYVVAASWSPHQLYSAPSTPHQQQQPPVRGEQLIATAAYDSTCGLFRLVSSSSSSSTGSASPVSGHPDQYHLEVIQQVPFNGYVQDVCFLGSGSAGVPPASGDNSGAAPSSFGSKVTECSQVDAEQNSQQASGGDGDGRSSVQLVVAIRGTNCLHVLSVQLARSARRNPGSCSKSDAAAQQESTCDNSSSSTSTPVWSVTSLGLVNMSEARDGHVSFSAMRLAVSPCTRYLLVATDSPILLVLRLSDWGVVRRLYGLDVDKFHNASVAWHRGSSYIMAGAAHAAVFVYHVGTAKVVAQLKGHTVNVRAINYDALTNRLATCSFDKTVKVYEEP